MQPHKFNTYVLVVKKNPQNENSKKIQSQNIGPYKIIDSPTLAIDKIEDSSAKQKTRHRSNIVPFYPKELFVQKQMEKYFTDNSLLRLQPKQSSITKFKFVSFSLDKPDLPSNNEPSLATL